MINAQHIVGRLLEDEEPTNPELTPQQPPGEGEEDIRDLFLRKDWGTAPFEAKGDFIGTYRYASMVQRLGDKRKQKVENNLYLERRPNNDIAVRYHETDIVTYHPDGSTTITTGGYPTKSTRAKMDSFIPGGWEIYTEKFEAHGEEAPVVMWNWRRNGREGAQPIRGGIGKMFWFNRHTNCGTWNSGWQIPFTDGDTILPDGTLQHQASEKRRPEKQPKNAWP